MPRIKGKVYVKVGKKPAKKAGPCWENGIWCAKNGSRWCQKDKAFLFVQVNEIGTCYKEVQKVLLRKELALRLMVLQIRKAQRGERSMPGARSGSKRGGKKAVKASPAASPAVKASLVASSLAPPPAAEAVAAYSAPVSGLDVLASAAEMVERLPVTSAPVAAPSWPQSLNKCALSQLIN